MECFIVESDDVSLQDRSLTIRGDEARHALRSLRLKPGEELMATDLVGTCYRATLGHEEAISKRELTAICRVNQVLPEHNEPGRKIILAMAILQQPSRFEDVVEKVTELGVSGFIPLITERSEKKQINRERLERILREATKQVSRARKPHLYDPMNLADALSLAQQSSTRKVVLHESVDVTNSLLSCIGDNKNCHLFIGPEGGFTNEEIKVSISRDAAIASLGTRRLRAETAAITAAVIAMVKE